MADVRELRGQLNERREKLARIFEQSKEQAADETGGAVYDLTKAEDLTGDSAARVEQVQKLNAEMEDLHKQVKDQDAIAATAGRVAEMGDLVKPAIHSTADRRDEQKPLASLGDLIVKSDAFKGYQRGAQAGPVSSLDLDLRATLFQTSAGWAPESLRTGRIEYKPTRPAPVVVDFFPEYTTSQAVVKYMEETTFTNAAVETSEAGTYAAGTLALTERSQTIRKIAVYLPVTDEQLEDESEARSYIDNRLVFMLRQRLDSQALVGDGNAPNVLGTENVSGIQTQALGIDPLFDATLKLFTLIRSDGFAEPSVGFINPTKWQTVRLTRTADGLYILGNPADPGPERLWGVPIAQTVAGTSTKLTAGDYSNFSGLYVRKGVDVQVGYVNDDFIKGQLSIRADVRVATVHFRPKAFGTVTGL